MNPNPLATSIWNHAPRPRAPRVILIVSDGCASNPFIQLEWPMSTIIPKSYSQHAGRLFTTRPPRTIASPPAAPAHCPRWRRRPPPVGGGGVSPPPAINPGSRHRDEVAIRHRGCRCHTSLPGAGPRLPPPCCANRFAPPRLCVWPLPPKKLPPPPACGIILST